MGDLASRRMGWRERSYIRDRHRHPGQCDLSITGGGSLRVSHRAAAESSYSGSYLNRSLQTYNQHSTQTMPRPPETVSTLDCPGQGQFPKTVSILFSQYCHARGFWLLASFLKMSLSSRPSNGTLAPEATNSCFKFSHSLSHISVKSADIGCALVMGWALTYR